jgi:hypothetical protein
MLVRQEERVIRLVRLPSEATYQGSPSESGNKGAQVLLDLPPDLYIAHACILTGMELHGVDPYSR